MRKIKYVLIVICILILTGCTVRDNVTVSPDGSVSENVYLLNKTEYLTSEKYSFKELMDMMVKPYENVLNLKKYSYSYERSKSLSGVKVYKNYDNLCSYFGNSAFNQYVYKYMDCKENNYYIEIQNATEYIPYCSECAEWPELGDIEFKISLPVSAAEQNADEINGTTYIWKYNKETQNKNFYLKVSKSALKESEREYFKNLERKKTRQKILIIGTIIGIVVLISVVAIIYYRKYKKNSFDYE